MGSFTRFTRYVKDFWKVFIRGENDDLQRQTLSMQKELARLQNRRMASDKEREAAALNQARGAVQRLRELHDSFLAAEAAASEFAAKMGEAARSSMEAHAETREQACKMFFMKQKELYMQEIKSDLQGETGLTVSELPSQPNGHEEASKVLESKSNGDDMTCVVATGRSVPNEEVESPMCSPDMQVTVEMTGKDLQQPNANAMPGDAASSNGIGLTDQDVLAQMMQEVKKQVRLEEKAQLDSLAREKAMLEKEIEAREKAEHAKS